MGILRIVKMEFESSSVEAFDRLFEYYQQEIASTPGCQKVILLKGTNHAGLRTTLSWWADQPALDAYRNSELFGEVWPQTKKLFASAPAAWSVDWPVDSPEFLPFSL